jgi:CubicO group peptidase (beta-lactamase class C family)
MYIRIGFARKRRGESMIRNIEKMVIFGVFLCCCACKGAPSERVDDYVQEHMKEYHVPGVSVAILKHGNVILSKGYGPGFPK